jgi:hypothetical protein
MSFLKGRRCESQTKPQPINTQPPQRSPKTVVQRRFFGHLDMLK